MKVDKYIVDAAEKWVQDESIAKDTNEVERAFRAGAKYIIDLHRQANYNEQFLKECKEARDSFVKVSGAYCIGEHLKLRTEADSLLIMYDQLVDRVASAGYCPSGDELGKICSKCKTFYTDEDADYDRNSMPHCPICGMINGGGFDDKRGSC